MAKIQKIRVERLYYTAAISKYIGCMRWRRTCGWACVWIRIFCPQLLNNQPLMFMVAKTRSSRFFAARMHEAAERGYVSDPPKFESILHPHHARAWEVCMHAAAADHDGTYVHEPHRPRPGSRWINCSPNSRTWESDTRQVKWTSDVWPAHIPWLKARPLDPPLVMHAHTADKTTTLITSTRCVPVLCNGSMLGWSSIHIWSDFIFSWRSRESLLGS